MRKIVAIVALLFAAFQLASTCHSSKVATSNVKVLFKEGYTCNVTAHLNHQDETIIRLITTNSSLPTLELVNLAGFNQSAISMTVVDTTSTTRSYKFKSGELRDTNAGAFDSVSLTTTYRFRLHSNSTGQSTDLYFTIDVPWIRDPQVSIVGSGYNNVTCHRDIIDTREVENTEKLSKFISLTVAHSDITSGVRYFSWDASNINASAMISGLKSAFIGFQCDFESSNTTDSTNDSSINILTPWNGSTVLNLSQAWLQFYENNTYSCVVSVIATERSNEHALIPLKVQTRIWYKKVPTTQNIQTRPITHSQYQAVHHENSLRKSLNHDQSASKPTLKSSLGSIRLQLRRASSLFGHRLQ